jgi:IS1 family transposase/transposase-like protein
MQCAKCSSNMIRWGRDRHDRQRYRCKPCGVTVTDTPPPSPIAPMRLPVDRALVVVSLLVEGMSIRAAERVTGHHRDTITRLLVLAGRKCERLMDALVEDVEVADVQADEIWCYVGMKERTKKLRKIANPQLGDAFTFVAIERDSKLVLAWHLGRRTAANTDAFMEKVDRATAGRLQLTTDGFNAYPEAVAYHLGGQVDFATLEKEYGQDAEGQRRYSPPQIIGTRRTDVLGSPAPARVCTSHVERQNLTMRMQLRRFTRLTNGFSKKWENLRCAVALHFAHYNLCRMHSSIRMTPAMKAGVARAPWAMEQLLRAAV